MSGEKSQPTLSILRGSPFNVAALRLVDRNEFPEGHVAQNH